MHISQHYSSTHAVLILRHFDTICREEGRHVSVTLLRRRRWFVDMAEEKSAVCSSWIVYGFAIHGHHYSFSNLGGGVNNKAKAKCQ